MKTKVEDRIIITDLFNIPGRGKILCTKPVQNPQNYVGEIWSYKGTTYVITGYEVMRCLLDGCMCIRSLGFKANVLGVEKRLKKC